MRLRLVEWLAVYGVIDFGSICVWVWVLSSCCVGGFGGFAGDAVWF